MSAVERRLGNFNGPQKQMGGNKKSPVNPEAIVRRLTGGRHTLPVGGFMPLGGKKGPSRTMFQRKTK